MWQRNSAVSRDSAAWLARELTPVTLRELSPAFGLTHPDSVRNLIRRADRALLGSLMLRGENNQPRPKDVVLGRPPEGAVYVR